jgi:hypothetical protein
VEALYLRDTRLYEPPHDITESGTKWGRLRGERHRVQCPAEAGALVRTVRPGAK